MLGESLLTLLPPILGQSVQLFLQVTAPVLMLGLGAIATRILTNQCTYTGFTEPPPISHV